MLRWLPPPAKGVLSLLLYTLNTVGCATPLFILAAFKSLIPISGCRRFCTRAIRACAVTWISINNWHQSLTADTVWNVTGLEDLSTDQWYLVLANHQSWVDILVLQRVFNRRIPLLNFFIKKELIWFPILGQAWWALDFPFMQRHSRAAIQKNPDLARQDLETTRRACEKFRNRPVAIMNFVEGTRFSSDKHRRQQSPFAGLLRPKAGGIAFVLGAMGDQLQCMLDVTIAYPGGGKRFWDFVSGRTACIEVCVRQLPLDDKIIGDYFGDPVYRGRFQQWLNDCWRAKEDCLAQLTARRRCDRCPACGDLSSRSSNGQPRGR
jgi:1-acyl-sn-glycerol-3-phosphate acyltransferase